MEGGGGSSSSINSSTAGVPPPPPPPPLASCSFSSSTTSTHNINSFHSNVNSNAPWISTNLTSKPEECSSSTEREARSVALEKAYVHDVYQQIACHFSDSRYRAWPRVKQFLLDLEPGSFVCDVGCGNGKYLSINPSIYKIGLDRCSNLANIAREKDHEVMICDNLALPFRDECFDAGLSIAVIHHFATTERRVAALKELARVLRIGGKLMVSVWAMEQRHRKFESQDVLVPWNRPINSSSDDKTSSIERDLNSTTTTTSDDDATHYHAYTQTSDSDSFPSAIHGVFKKRGRVRHHRGRSIDPTCPSSSQSSSDLSSPNESCYSFVRRALQKLAGTRRNRGGRRPWFLQGLDIAAAETDEIVGAAERFAYMDCGDDIGGCLDYHPHYHPHHNRHNLLQRNSDGGNNGCGVGGNSSTAGAVGEGEDGSISDSFIPIELRQLESTEYSELFREHNNPKQNSNGGNGTNGNGGGVTVPVATSASSKAALLFSNVLYPRRRRTLETACGETGHSDEAQTIGAQPKSKSLSDLLGLLPVGLLRSTHHHHLHRKGVSKEECGGNSRKKGIHHRATTTSTNNSIDGQQRSFFKSRMNGNVSPLVQSYEDPNLPAHRRHVSVQTESLEESLEHDEEDEIDDEEGFPGEGDEPLETNSIPDANPSTFQLIFPQQEQKRQRQRPVLVKQKRSISSDPEDENGEEAKKTENNFNGEGSGSGEDSKGETQEISSDGHSLNGEEVASDQGSSSDKRSPREGISPNSKTENENGPAQGSLTSLGSSLGSTSEKHLHPSHAAAVGGVRNKLKHQKKSIPSSIPLWKQTSMNDELIFSGDRLKEKERLKQQVQKQCSLNEELIYNKGRKTGQKETQDHNTRWDQMKEAFLKNSSNVKCFQLIKNGLSRGFRGSTEGNSGGSGSAGGGIGSVSGAQSSEINGQGLLGGADVNSNGTCPGRNGNGEGILGGVGGNSKGETFCPAHSQKCFIHQHQMYLQQQQQQHPHHSCGANNGGDCIYAQQHSPQPPRTGATSLRNGIVRMLQNWKQSEDGSSPFSPSSPGGHRCYNVNAGSPANTAKRALFPPFFLRRSSAGSLTLAGKQANKPDLHHVHAHHLNHHGGSCSSPGPLSPLGKGVVGEGVELNGASNGSTSGNKLLPGVRHVRKLSREDGSDSSKDSSFQSDTSVDSEDSFASVIFIPKSSGGLDDFGPPGEFCGTRANSTDSDRSPKSPASRLSPPNHGNLPKSPSPLAQEIQQVMMRKRSPEVSPAAVGGDTSCGIGCTTGSSSSVGSGRHLRLTPGGNSTSSGFSGSSGCGEATKFLFDETATTRLLAGDSGNMSPAQFELDDKFPPPECCCGKGTEDHTQDGGGVRVTILPTGVQLSPPPIPLVFPPPEQQPEQQSQQTSQLESQPPQEKPQSKSGRKRVEKIEVLRKPAMIPEGKSGLTRQLVRRSLPKALAVELFNPETDDADTSDTSSSSPNSVSSVVSVVNEDSSGVAMGLSLSGTMDEAKQPIITEEEVDDIEEEAEGSLLEGDRSNTQRNNRRRRSLALVGSMESGEERGPLLLEEDEEEHELDLSLGEDLQSTSSHSHRHYHHHRHNKNNQQLSGSGSSLENLVTGSQTQSSSPKARRKITLAKLGSTSEWLSSLEVTPPLPLELNSGKRSLKNLKKFGQRSSAEETLPGLPETSPEDGTGANLVTELTTAGISSSVGIAGAASSANSGTAAPSLGSANAGTLSLEMLEERDSLFDSMENLTSSKQQPSRNPSIDSSVRMSSTCSCSIRGGDSFDSWTSAKSSLTNSSCTQPPSSTAAAPHKTSLSSILPLSSSSLPLGSSSGIGGSGGGSYKHASKMSSLDSNGTNNSKITSSSAATAASAPPYPSSLPLKSSGGSGGVGIGAGSSGSATTGRRRDAQSRIRVQSSSKSSSAAGDDVEDSTALTCHRYYHVFREGELDKLIEKYVQNLHIISSYYDHANWCIIAEKVQVWTI